MILIEKNEYENINDIYPGESILLLSNSTTFRRKYLRFFTKLSYDDKYEFKKNELIPENIYLNL